MRALVSARCPGWLKTVAADWVAASDAAQRLGIGDLTAARLLILAQGGTLGYVLGVQTTPRELLDIAFRQPELAPAAHRRLRDTDDRTLSRELRDAILVRGVHSPHEAAVALHVIAAAAGCLLPPDEREIFAWCLAKAGARPDPYDPDATLIGVAASQAAAAILAVDSTLDEAIIEALKAPATRVAAQNLASSALKEHPERAAPRFASYIHALTPTSEQAIRFAEDCDTGQGTLQALPPRTRLMQRIQDGVPYNLRNRIELLGAILLPVCAAALLAVICQSASGSIATVGIDPGVAIGALAVLAAVHILTVQLAAQRLPGPIASASILPPLTLGAYVTGLAMLAVAILGREKPAPAWQPSLVASGLLLVFVVLVFATTISSLRTTSVAAACELMSHRSMGRARRTGRRAGKTQQGAVQILKLVEDHGYLRKFISPQETVQRYPIRARLSGFVQIDARRLASIAPREPWQSGNARVDLIALPGIAVTPGEELASIVPATGGSIDARAINSIDRAIEVRQERPLERFAELCVALCLQTSLLVRSGDPGGARRILAALTVLLREHLKCVVAERGDFVGALPTTPAVAQTIDQAVNSLVTAASETERDILNRLLSACIQLAKPQDGMIALIAHKLSSRATTLAEFGVLYRAGCHAAILESGMDLQFAQDGLHALAGGMELPARFANESAGRLVLYCAQVAPRLSRAAWSRWWSTAQKTPQPDRVRIAIRIGAGALPVGNLSLCVEIALALRDADFDSLMEGIRSPEQAEFEGLISQLYGRLLGVDAEQRIIDFLDFAQRINKALPPIESDQSSEGQERS